MLQAFYSRTAGSNRPAAVAAGVAQRALEDPAADAEIARQLADLSASPGPSWEPPTVDDLRAMLCTVWHTIYCMAEDELESDWPDLATRREANARALAQLQADHPKTHYTAGRAAAVDGDDDGALAAWERGLALAREQAAQYRLAALPPAEALALLEEGVAALKRCDTLPDEWRLSVKRAAGDAAVVRPVVEAHAAAGKAGWDKALCRDVWHGDERSRVPYLPRCSACGVFTAAAKRWRCKAAHWSKHKAECKEVQKAPEAGAAAGPVAGAAAEPKETVHREE
eukprot:scaffold1.g5524.t1